MLDSRDACRRRAPGSRSDWLLLALIAMGALSCDGGNGAKSNEESGGANDRVFTERRALLASAPTLALGDECTQTGRAGCRTGLCLKHRPGYGAGYVCSKSCESATDCPPDWTCNSIYPAPHSSFCVPPASWVYGAATVRATSPSGGLVSGNAPPPWSWRGGVGAESDGGAP